MALKKFLLWGAVTIALAVASFSAVRWLSRAPEAPAQVAEPGRGDGPLTEREIAIILEGAPTVPPGQELGQDQIEAYLKTQHRADRTLSEEDRQKALLH
jgi:hypothetical protein